jgi:hypothetical protein
MARAGDDRLATVTLLAALTDLIEPGELALFIDHSQMHFLESMMWNRGYLSTDQMAGAFQLLRSNDLIWSRLVHDYLMGVLASALPGVLISRSSSGFDRPERLRNNRQEERLRKHAPYVRKLPNSKPRYTDKALHQSGARK